MKHNVSAARGVEQSLVGSLASRTSNTYAGFEGSVKPGLDGLRVIVAPFPNFDPAHTSDRSIC